MSPKKSQKYLNNKNVKIDTAFVLYYYLRRTHCRGRYKIVVLKEALEMNFFSYKSCYCKELD